MHIPFFSLIDWAVIIEQVTIGNKSNIRAIKKNIKLNETTIPRH